MKHTPRQQMAVCAAAATTAIVAVQQHIHIVFSQPGTWLFPIHHKCGWSVLACLGWMFAELAQKAAGAWLESFVPALEA